MTNALEIITAKRTDIAAREIAHKAEGHAIELDKAELAGMEKMVQLLGPAPRVLSRLQATSSPIAFANEREKGSIGRQRGAISKRWRLVLEFAALAEDEWLSASRFVEIIKSLENRDATQPQVRRILDGYAENGFVEANESGFYRVTELARNKFGLAEPSASNALNENGATEAAPEAGLDSRPILPSNVTPNIFD